MTETIKREVEVSHGLSADLYNLIKDAERLGAKMVAARMGRSAAANVVLKAESDVRVAIEEVRRAMNDANRSIDKVFTRGNQRKVKVAKGQVVKESSTKQPKNTEKKATQPKPKASQAQTVEKQHTEDVPRVVVDNIASDKNDSQAKETANAIEPGAPSSQEAIGALQKL